MNKSLLLLLVFPLLSWSQSGAKSQIDSVLTQWHKAAAEADFDSYFNAMSEDGVFIGTDAGENWQRNAFMEFSRPYFERGKAWDFSAVERNIYLSSDGEMAWFDELLSTWMQLCRGSGVMRKEQEGWKIVHYVLSMTIPNDQVQEVIPLKKEADRMLMQSLGITKE